MALRNLVRRNFYVIAALTGTRRSNLTALEWRNVNLDRKTLTQPKTKNGTSPTLPLSDEAVRLLRKLHELDRRWVFPAASASGHIAEPQDATVRGNIHQLRHAFTSAGASCGVPRHVLKKLRGDVTKEDAMDGYVHDIDSHAAINQIAIHLTKRWLGWQLDA